VNDLPYRKSPQNTSDSSRNAGEVSSNPALHMGTKRVTIQPALSHLPAADLSINIRNFPSPVQLGSKLSYTITLTNNGPDPAAEVLMTDVLPVHATFISANATQGSCHMSGGIVYCRPGTILPEREVSISIIIIPTLPGRIRNTAQVEACEYDPDPSNNVDTLHNTVTPPGPLDNWHRRELPIPVDTIFAITYDGSRFAAAGSAGMIFTSINGINWHPESSGISDDIYGICSGNNLLVAAGNNGTIITSIDGSEWKRQDSMTRQCLNSIAFANGIYAAVGAGGTIIRSDDGIKWIDCSLPINSLLGISNCNGIFLATGELGTILASPDGLNWNSRCSGTSAHLYAAGYGNHTFVVIGEQGTILTSYDLINWTPGYSGTCETLYDICFSVDIFTIVGPDIQTSPDGFNWAVRYQENICPLRGACYGDTTFIVSGSNGTILQSDPLQPFPPPHPTRGINLAR